MVIKNIRSHKKWNSNSVGRRKGRNVSLLHGPPVESVVQIGLGRCWVSWSEILFRPPPGYHRKLIHLDFCDSEMDVKPSRGF